MGAGKTHVMKQLHSNGQFPLETFVSVDPDEIRRLLPEFQVYVESCPERAGELTRKEAGMVAEILTEAALERGQNVLVDGSLRDAAWYAAYFQTLRQSFHSLKLGIIHVTAPIGEIFQRVEVRHTQRHKPPGCFAIFHLTIDFAPIFTATGQIHRPSGSKRRITKECGTSPKVRRNTKAMC